MTLSVDTGRVSVTPPNDRQEWRARRATLSLKDYVEGVLSGDRMRLARAISLVESTNPDHQKMAQDLLVQLAPYAGKAHRIGITGVPGVGKSTFIETFGNLLIDKGHKVAVLAVDPSSSRSGGSILGDKTRMETLSNNPNAYIRPSPSSGRLGGVTRTTRETMMVMEAAGYDVVLVETVGAGQNETVVADMTDFFLVLMLPGAGDDLQGIKKGVLELADLIAVNKCEDDNEQKAEAARQHYATALHIMTPNSPNWSPPVLKVSGLKGIGLEQLWERIEEHHRIFVESGELDEARRHQRIKWMWNLIEDKLLDAMKSNPDVRASLPKITQDVESGNTTVPVAVLELLRMFGLNVGLAG
ncbi:methylmalonyl Co-A mutase-associated GTPase MeaB [Telmatospirillum sp.]|uniref:methylmalonyl Co-A mutase-associated GTPase MeaB n=1 Tax=Telmatospirillum sp. TaxID=2079197 RepID=UPI00283FFE43|nr:methylmalonyl Co-A mutase-associated GTPase MeaB [Telmatospirillum sp.]MDR3437594.1 methylmalonyl Co-A mutase-associated GTPase MeaB [Telmatospirillum sp.]